MSGTFIGQLNEAIAKKKDTLKGNLHQSGNRIDEEFRAAVLKHWHSPLPPPRTSGKRPAYAIDGSSRRANLTNGSTVFVAQALIMGEDINEPVTDIEILPGTVRAHFAALPAAGQLGLTQCLLFGAGGCATNTAACLRRLGRPAKVLGKVGDDVFGNLVIEDLKRLGIDASGVQRSRTHPTSGTVIINVIGEERRYIHCIGANADFSFSDIDCLALNGAKALYLGGYMAMPRFGAEDLAQLFREAKKRSLTTILDVVIPSGQSIPGEEVAAMLAYTDVFLPNDDEACALTGLREPRAQAGYLGRMNPDCCVVVTQGRRGALAQRNDEVIQVGSYAVEAIDESGSGDAFAARGWP
jgi:sugar/nucleoside kinase (ribokinase family)